MAITGQVVASKPNCISFLLTHDGAAGNAITLTAAQLIAAAPPGHFREFLSVLWPGHNTANARLRIMGEGAAAALGGLGPNLAEVDHCRCFVRQRTGLLTAILVDADTDAVTVTQSEINITTDAVAGSFQLDVEYQHTIIR